MNNTTLGKIGQEAGVLFKGNKFSCIKKVMPAGEKIAPHTHAGKDIIFTVLKGRVELALGENEKHLLSPGILVSFDGKYSISADIQEDAEISITLIEQ